MFPLSRAGAGSESEVQQHVREGKNGTEVILSNNMCGELGGFFTASPRVLFWWVSKVKTDTLMICSFASSFGLRELLPGTQDARAGTAHEVLACTAVWTKRRPAAC